MVALMVLHVSLHGDAATHTNGIIISQALLAFGSLAESSLCIEQESWHAFHDCLVCRTQNPNCLRTSGGREVCKSLKWHSSWDPLLPASDMSPHCCGSRGIDQERQ